MKFVIQGRDYSPANIGRLSLWDVKELKKQTGLTVADIEESANYLEQFDGVAELMSDMKAVDMLGAIMWLARWTSGDRVSFEESMQVPMADIDMVLEDDEEPGADEPDPTVSALPDGAAAEAGALAEEPVAAGV